MSGTLTCVGFALNMPEAQANSCIIAKAPRVSPNNLVCAFKGANQ